MALDWQTMASMGLVMAAGSYLLRRWWPGLRGVFRPLPASADAAGAACHGSTSSASPASCSSGCGQCGQTTTPAKDHRVLIVRRTPD